MNKQNGVVTIGRVGGIDVKVHWSWLFIIILITYQLASGYYPNQLPDESLTVYVAMGLLSAILLFAAVLIHEFSHSFMAISRGLKVRDITLFILGGVSAIEDEPEVAFDEFVIAFVGPLSSLVLAGLCYLLAMFSATHTGDMWLKLAVLSEYLAFVNLMLGLFNLIPGFPLDGGRVLRSLIWWATKKQDGATIITGYLGKFIAGSFTLWGLYEILFQGYYSGLWTIFIGLYLFQAARQSIRLARWHQQFAGVYVGEIMAPPPPVIVATMSLQELFMRYIVPHNQNCFVVADTGHITGVITLSDLQKYPDQKWGQLEVGQAMQAKNKISVIRSTDPLEEAWISMNEEDLNECIVIDAQGKLAGLLSRLQVMRYLHSRSPRQRVFNIGRPSPQAVPVPVVSTKGDNFYRPPHNHV